MFGWHIEGVADRRKILLICIAGAKSAIVIGHPRQVALKLKLFANIDGFAHVANAEMVGLETGKGRVFGLEMFGCTYAVETVYNQYFTAFVRSFVSTQNLRGERDAALVACYHFIVITHTRFEREREFIRLHFLAIVPILASFAGIDYIISRCGGCFKRINTLFPTQNDLLIVFESDAEILYGQRLHHVWRAVLLVVETEHRLVDGAAHHEAEAWVEAVFHIREILMREELQQYGRHFGFTAFGITRIMESASGPFGSIKCAHIIHELRLHIIGKIARELTSGTRWEGLVFLIVPTRINDECTDNLVPRRCAGIGMESECKFYRNA